MSDQFQKPNFARGVKLCVEHVYVTLADMQAAAADAAIALTAERLAPCRMSWHCPWIGAESAEGGDPVAIWPFTLPPFQQLFNRTTLADPNYPVTLAEISLAFDQRAEPDGITSPGSTSTEGKLTLPDMSRYNLTVSLFERQPSLVAGTNPNAPREVLRMEIAGTNAFGNEFARTNPLVIDPLSIPLKPFMVYYWEVRCPGLFSTDGGALDIWTCTVSVGGWVPGDTARLTIGAVNYDYVVVLGDTATTIAAAIATLASTDVAYVVWSVGAVVHVRARNAGLGIGVASLFLAGAGTFIAVNTNVGADGTVEQLAMPSFTLTATILSPLTLRDHDTDFPAAFPNPGIQNMPVRIAGPKTGTTIALTTPAADAVITGNDVQGAFANFDGTARDRMPSGFGGGHGAVGNPMQAADSPPTEMLENDAYYSAIVMPMWHGQRNNSIRSGDVPTMGMPYAAEPFVAPWAGPTMDRAVIRVPSNFVIHHIFAVWNVYSPPSPNTNGHIGGGAAPVGATYTQRVGVGITSGLRGDEYLHQQIAFAEWTPATVGTFLLDSFDLPNSASVCYRILQIPLGNAGAPWDANSWLASGKPFFVGDGNTQTQSRYFAFDPGAAAFVAPITEGGETLLEIRWEKLDDPAVGLDGGPASAVRVGQGGEWIILVGKQTVIA